MNEFGLIGNFSTEASDRDALVGILEAAAKIMEDVEACKHYIVYKDAGNEEKVWISEIWDSKEAHDESLTRDDVRAIISQAIPLLKGKPEAGIQLIPISGKGL